MVRFSSGGAVVFLRAAVLFGALSCFFVDSRGTLTFDDETRRESQRLSAAAKQVLANNPAAQGKVEASKGSSSAESRPITNNQNITISGAERRGEVQIAVNRGLRFIARAQIDADGSFAFANDESADNRGPYATAALAALAFMADGNSETRGPYATNLKRAVDYLLDKANFDSDDTEAYLAADGDNLSRMHGHGYATLALAQILGMSGATHGNARLERIKKTLAAAVKKIEHSQGTTGGWYYTPTRNDDHEGSVTITMVQALRAAKDAGVVVNSNVIKRAVDYVRKSQKVNPAAEDNGSFRYRIGSNDTSVALTAAAISTLNATGDYDSQIIDSAMKYVQLELTKRREFGHNPNIQKFPSYELLYLAQAFRQFRDPSVFQVWYREEVPRLLKQQRVLELDTREEVGSWFDPYGRVLGTAIAVIVLRADDSYLPILER